MFWAHILATYFLCIIHALNFLEFMENRILGDFYSSFSMTSLHVYTFLWNRFLLTLPAWALDVPLLAVRSQSECMCLRDGPPWWTVKLSHHGTWCCPWVEPLLSLLRMWLLSQQLLHCQSGPRFFPLAPPPVLVMQQIVSGVCLHSEWQSQLLRPHIASWHISSAHLHVHCPVELHL